MNKTKQIYIGNVSIGGDAPISIQSMTNTNTADFVATSAQIKELANAGCDIIRVAIPNIEAIESLPKIMRESPIPVIGDIHFDHKLAILAIKNGINGIRINPGNIGSKEKVIEIAKIAKQANIPIRVGGNSGSLPKGLFEKLHKKYNNYNKAMSEALVQATLEQCRILEDCDFRNIKVSLKSSNVPITVQAYESFSKISDYPLHLGITEAGTIQRGTIKSAIGIGSLLLQGIGNTIRVSLTANPIEEIKVAKMLLESINLRIPQPEIISCPSCGRTEIELFKLVDKVEQTIKDIKRSGKTITIKKIAIMGCVVNGPGEAKEADIGIAGGKNSVVLFKRGQIIGKFTEAEGLKRLEQEINENTR